MLVISWRLPIPYIRFSESGILHGLLKERERF